jgi:hypothetical protein
MTDGRIATVRAWLPWPTGTRVMLLPAMTWFRKSYVERGGHTAAELRLKLGSRFREHHSRVVRKIAARAC